MANLPTILRKRTLAAFLVATFLVDTAPLRAAPPDLTTIPMPVVDTSATYNLGSTGARGWIYENNNLLTSESRQILVTQVDPGSPAAGILAVNDVILGASGTAAAPVAFQADARKGLANAITAAEETANGGALKILRWRGGTTTTRTLALEVMGTYSATAPYDCPKSAKILQQAAAHVAANSEFGRYSAGGLALLASGNPACPRWPRRYHYRRRRHQQHLGRRVGRRHPDDAMDGRGHRC